MSLRTVGATREGLYGGHTAAGLTISPGAIFVALPSTRALWKIVRVVFGNKVVLAPVLDVGPWNEHDEAYVFGDQRPAAEGRLVGGGILSPFATDERGRQTNGAGIDLSDGVLHALGILDFRLGKWQVQWEFVDPT